MSGGRADDGRVEFRLASGATVRGRSSVLAGGVVYRRLEAPGVEDLIGRGVYYGMYPAAAARFRDREVVIVGGANSAGQAALHLAEHVARVTVLCRGEALDRSMSRYLTDRIEDHPAIAVRTGCELTQARGDGWLEEVAFRGPDGETNLRADALFVLIGGEPLTLAIRDWLDLDDRGYVLTGPDLPRADWPLERDPMFLETSQPGVFAAGDLRHGSIKRVASAVGDGAMAVSLVHSFLRGR